MLVSLNEKAFSLISLNHFFIKTYRHYYFAADRERGAWLHSLCWLPPVSSRQSADACLRIRHERIKTARSYACPLLGSRSLSTIIEDHDYGMTGLSVPVYILTSVAYLPFPVDDVLWGALPPMREPASLAPTIRNPLY